MNYQEKVQKVLDCMEEFPFPLTEGDSYTEDGFLIECIHSSEEVDEDLSGSRESYFVCIDIASGSVHFHYGGDSYDIDEEGDKNYRDDWGFTYSTFDEVGGLCQPYYRSWLDQNGFTLETKELDESPWLVNVIKRKED